MEVGAFIWIISNVKKISKFEYCNMCNNVYFQWIYNFWGIFFEEKKRTGMYKSSGDLTEVGMLEFRKN